MKNTLELSDSGIVPLDHIAPGVIGIRIIFVNVFAIGDADGWVLGASNRPAARLAFLNAGMVFGMSLLADYPGGVYRKLSFKTHRTGDVVQMALAGLAPWLFGFAHSRAAQFFTDRPRARPL